MISVSESEFYQIQQHIYRMLLKRAYLKPDRRLEPVDECFEEIAKVLGILELIQPKGEQGVSEQ